MSDSQGLNLKQLDIIDCSDQRIMTMVYETLGPAALSKTQYIVGSQSAAEEIVQEVFIKLWNKKPQFDHIKQAYAWIYQACTNASIDWMRKKANQTSEFDESYMTDENSYISDGEGMALKQILKQFLSELNEKEAQVFVYQYMEGLKQQEIVEVAGIPRRTLARIQDKLKLKLEKFKGRLT